MKQQAELYSRVFSNEPGFMYLPDSDRYFLKQFKPEMKFNVIGTGNNGQEHIRVTLFEGRATIKGIYDPNPGSVAGAKNEFSKYVKDRELLVYSSLEKACNDPEIDGLIISTPNFSHIDVIRKVIESGKNILLEKPMATNVKDAYEIMNIAKNYPAVFQIGLQYRYKSIYTETIHEIFARRSLGDIKTISIAEHRIPFLDKVKQLNKFSEFSGGTLVSCHASNVG